MRQRLLDEGEERVLCYLYTLGPSWSMQRLAEWFGFANHSGVQHVLRRNSIQPRRPGRPRKTERRAA